ncbi:MAG: hypothetical protein GY929_11945 [Actinomycetia bacterium]|nr:hypothetical protein [Actinomycetes bacterium]
MTSESRLTALLAERAHQIDPHPDLDGILRREPTVDPPPADLVVVDHQRPRWLLVGAAVFVVVVGAVAIAVSGGNDESIRPAGEPLDGPIRESHFVIEFEPDVPTGSVEAVEEWLRADPRVVGIEPVGQAGPGAYRVTVHTAMADDPLEVVDAVYSALSLDGMAVSGSSLGLSLPIDQLPPDVNPNQVWSGPRGGMGMQELTISLWSSPSHRCGVVRDGPGDPFGSPPQPPPMVVLFCGTGELVVSAPFDVGDSQFRALVGHLPSCVVDLRPTGPAMTEGHDSAVATSDGTVEALFDGDPGLLRLTLEDGGTAELELPPGESSRDWPPGLCD